MAESPGVFFQMDILDFNWLDDRNLTGSEKALPIESGIMQHMRTRNRTNNIPNGAKASAAGLSGRACVTRMRSGEKGEM